MAAVSRRLTGADFCLLRNNVHYGVAVSFMFYLHAADVGFPAGYAVFAHEHGRFRRAASDRGDAVFPCVIVSPRVSLTFLRRPFR